MGAERYKARGTNESPSSSTNGYRKRERRQEEYMPDREERFDDETPTFLLDVPVLNIDELDLEVEDLRAHVSLRAELANLVKINVGLDVYLDKVKLNIQGIEAQALLKVNLDRVLGTLDRALEAINRNPQILSEVVQDVDSAVAGGAGRGVDQEVGQDRETTPQTDDLVDRVSHGTNQTVRRAGDEPGNVTEPALNQSEETEDEAAADALGELQIEEEYVDERGRIVGRARDESGNVVQGVLDEEGKVTNPSVSEEAGDPESEDDGEVYATDAARRKANELGVKLSRVRGTGSGGRVLVKDVERAAKSSAADSA
jgi:hypothetical protein